MAKISAAASFCLLFAASMVWARNDWTPHLTLDASLRSLNYVEKLSDNTNQNQEILRTNAQFSLKPNSHFRLRLRPGLQYDPLNLSDVEKFYAVFPEAWVEVRGGSLALQLGLNTLSWGVTDVFNPVDVVNPRIYFDPFNAEKKGTPSLLLKWDASPVTVEAIYIPWQPPSDLPGENGRWLPREIEVSKGPSPVQILLPQQIQYSYLPNQDIDAALTGNFGGRISYQGAGFDSSVIYFEGSPTAPAIQPVLTGAAVNLGSDIIFALDPNISLRPIYNRRRTTGATFQTTVLDWIGRAVIAYSAPQLSSRTVTAGWAQESSLSLEHGFAVGAQTLTTLLQVTLARHEDAPDNTVSSVNRIFDRGYFLGLRLSLPQDWTLSSGGLYDSVFSGSYVQLKIDKKLADAWTADATVEKIDGSAGTPLGTYRKNSRVGARITHYF